jgi:hypothetical protein
MVNAENIQAGLLQNTVTFTIEILQQKFGNYERLVNFAQQSKLHL